MKILYFAWLQTRTGLAEETIDLPEGISTVANLINWLKQRSEGHSEALSDLSVVRVAINQEYAEFDASIGPDDEVALFPPVTGG